MTFNSVFHELAAILMLAGVIGVVALKLRQPLIIGYIIAGILVGPAALNGVSGGSDLTRSAISSAERGRRISRAWVRTGPAPSAPRSLLPLTHEARSASHEPLSTTCSMAHSLPEPVMTVPATSPMPRGDD